MRDLEQITCTWKPGARVYTGQQLLQSSQLSIGNYLETVVYCMTGSLYVVKGVERRSLTRRKRGRGKREGERGEREGERGRGV